MIDVFYFDHGVKKGRFSDINTIMKKHRVWVDVTGVTKDESELIRIAFNLHPLSAEDLYKSRVRTKVEEFKDYIVCIFHGLDIKKKVVFYEQDFILGPNFIISNHRKEIPYYQQLKKDKLRLGLFLSRGCDFVLSNFLSELIEGYFPVIAKIDEEIEDLEELAANNPSRDILTRVFRLKKLIIAIKKMTFSQRDKIAMLGKENFSLIQQKTAPYFRDVYDHSIRIYDLIDSSRDAIANTFDVYMSSVTNSTNQVMKLLSIIATIMLPLSVLTGVFGTNFDDLPGAAHANGFWVMVLAMVLISLVMIYLFKRKHWI